MKAEKAIREYGFLNWLDSFVQPRSNIVKRHARVEEEESNEEDEECDAQGLDDEANIGYDESNYEEERGDEEESGAESGSESLGSIVYAPTQDSQQSQKLPTVEKNRKGHSKRSLKEKSSNVSLKKLKKGVQGSVKEALLEKMEFSVISKMNSRLNDRSKRKGEKKENVKPDIEDVFCQTLALEQSNYLCSLDVLLSKK